MTSSITRLQLALLTGGLLSASAARAQQVSLTPKPERLSTFSLKLGISPLLSRSYQLSAEKVLGAARRHAVVLTPQLYSGEVTSFTSRVVDGDKSRVRGYGLNLQHRVYLDARTRPMEGLYIGSSVQYQHFQLNYVANSWEQEQDANGILFYQYGPHQQRTTIDRYGAAVGLGWQTFLPGTPAFIDLYLGFGYRHVKRTATTPDGLYDRNSLDYAHAGTYTPFAVRFGVAL